VYDEKRIQIPLKISMQQKQDEMFEQGMITTTHPRFPPLALFPIEDLPFTIEPIVL